MMRLISWIIKELTHTERPVSIIIVYRGDWVKSPGHRRTFFADEGVVPVVRVIGIPGDRRTTFIDHPEVKL